VFPSTVVKVDWCGAEEEYETEVDKVAEAEVFVEAFVGILVKVFAEAVVEVFVDGAGD
jgi:hypothetical protein